MDKSSAVRVDLPILDVKIMGKSTRAVVEPIPEVEEKVDAPVSAVKIDKPVLAIKKLRTIASMGAPEPGDEPKDGDGDGLVYDNTPRERPAALDFPGFVPEQISETWSKIHQTALDRRREAARKRGLPPEARPTIGEIQQAVQNYDTDFMEALARQVFEHEGLGKDGTYRSEVTDVSTETSSGGKERIVVEGRIYDDSGQRVGYFIRNIEPFGADDSDTPSIYHEELDMKAGQDDARGLGIGSSFIMASELEYGAHGFERIHLVAALSDGPRVWARDDFDWTTPDDRQEFLLGILRQINANPDKYFSDKEERKAYRKMIEEALNEDFDDPDRLRPVHFAMAPEFTSIMNDARRGAGLRYKAERPVRNYSIRRDIGERNQAIISTGVATDKNYDSVKNLRGGNITLAQARPLSVDPKIEAAHEKQIVQDILAEAGIQVDIDELDRTNGWGAVWEQHGETILDLVSVKGDFKTRIPEGTLDRRHSAEELATAFEARHLGLLKHLRNSMAGQIRLAKDNRLNDKDYQQELLQFDEMLTRLEGLGPDEQAAEIKSAVARGLIENMAAIRQNIKRHPEFENRVFVIPPGRFDDYDEGAATGISSVQMTPGGPFSFKYGLKLNSSVGLPRAYSSFMAKTSNFGIGDRPLNVVTHEFGHMLDSDAGAIRAGIDPTSSDIIGDFAKKYPRLQDSLPGIAHALRTSDIQDLSTKISDIPAGSPDTLMGNGRLNNTQANLMTVLQGFFSPTANMYEVKVPGENINDFEPSIYDMSRTPAFRILMSPSFAKKPYSKAINEEVAKRVLKDVPDIKAYAAQVSAKLQTLLHEATDGLGVYLQNRGDVMTELMKRSKGLTEYANTAPEEFIAEAHAMFEMMETHPAAKANPQHAAMIAKARILYEFMVDRDRVLELGIPENVQARLVAAVLEANALARDFENELGFR